MRMCKMSDSRVVKHYVIVFACILLFKHALSVLCNDFQMTFLIPRYPSTSKLKYQIMITVSSLPLSSPKNFFYGLFPLVSSKQNF